MRRLTVSFTDGQFAWVQEQADERDRPKKWVIQQAVDGARGEESVYGDMVTPGDTSTDRTAPGDTSIHQRLDELEQRLADLEAGEASPDLRPPSETPQPAAERSGETGGDTSRSDTDHTGGASAGREVALQANDEAGDLSAGDDSDVDLDDLLREWRPGRSSEDHRERRASARAVLEFLRDRGSATRGDLVDELHPEHGVDGQSEETWWRNTVRGTLEEGTGGALAIAADAGLVEREQGPPHVYRWVA